MTLVETMFALTILTMLLAGLVSTMIQSRRLTEGSINRTLATVIAQSYMEQLKTMLLQSMADINITGSAQLTASFALPTVVPISGGTQADTLYTTPSTVAIPALSTITPGTTPTGVIDNLKDFSPNQNGVGTSGSAATTWLALFPNSTSAGRAAATSLTPAVNDLHLNIWVWVTDPNAGTVLANTVYGITMIFTWQFSDGGRTRYMMDEIHSMRSVVPST